MALARKGIGDLVASAPRHRRNGMTRRFSGKQLVVASHNAGKVREIGG
jgi:hypothetical protein